MVALIKSATLVAYLIMMKNIFIVYRFLYYLSLF
jgi:hypothetical protein